MTAFLFGLLALWFELLAFHHFDKRHPIRACLCLLFMGASVILSACVHADISWSFHK